MSDTTIISVVGSILAAGGSAFATWMAYKIAVLQRTANDVHTLVNSAMGVQLAMHESTTMQLAERTQKPEDMANYVAAKKMNDAHKARQATVDAKTSNL